MQDKYCDNCYDIYLTQSQYTKVATFGRHHKGGGAAFGRATSFVVSFVLPLNKVDIVAVTTIRTSGRTGGRIHWWSLVSIGGVIVSLGGIRKTTFVGLQPVTKLT